MEQSGKIYDRRILFILSFIALVLAAILLNMYAPYRNKDNIQIKALAFSGTFQTCLDETPMMIGHSKLPSAYRNKEIILYGSFDRDLLEGEQLFFLVKYLEVHIIFRDKEIYSFGTEEKHPQSIASSGMSWSHITIPEDILTSDEVKIVLKSKYKNNYYSAYSDFIGSLCTGDKGALVCKVLSDVWLYVLLSFAFIIMSLLLLVLYIILKVHKIKLHISILYFALFSASINIWKLLYPYLSSLFIDNSIVIMELELIFMMMSAVCLLFYLGSFMQTKMRFINHVIILVFMSFSILFFLLQIIGIADPYSIRTFLTILMGLTAIISIFEILYEIIQKKNYEFHFLLKPGLVFLFFAVLELINYGIEITKLGNILFAGFMILISVQLIHAISYISLAIRVTEKNALLEKELLQSRITVMLSQIKPHFLFNALVAIQQLCDEEPQKAIMAIENFSDFLRGNIDTLSSSDCISFEKELQHVTAYLSLEQIRFENKLFVYYDIQVRDFSLPPLTVQPIVENAVRYGIAAKSGKGKLFLRTREDEENYSIIIEDDGRGYHVECPPTDSREHLGINNVRARLAAQCGGTLIITSIIDKGTTVVLTIPKKGDFHEITDC